MKVLILPSWYQNEKQNACYFFKEQTGVLLDKKNDKYFAKYL